MIQTLFFALVTIVLISLCFILPTADLWQPRRSRMRAFGRVPLDQGRSASRRNAISLALGAAFGHRKIEQLTVPTGLANTGRFALADGSEGRYRVLRELEEGDQLVVELEAGLVGEEPIGREAA